jgi:hypothetical protein
LPGPEPLGRGASTDSNADCPGAGGLSGSCGSGRRGEALLVVCSIVRESRASWVGGVADVSGLAATEGLPFWAVASVTRLLAVSVASVVRVPSALTRICATVISCWESLAHLFPLLWQPPLHDVSNCGAVKGGESFRITVCQRERAFVAFDLRGVRPGQA